MCTSIHRKTTPSFQCPQYLKTSLGLHLFECDKAYKKEKCVLRPNGQKSGGRIIMIEQYEHIYIYIYIYIYI